jgi:hypothetical protein
MVMIYPNYPIEKQMKNILMNMNIEGVGVGVGIIST